MLSGSAVPCCTGAGVSFPPLHVQASSAKRQRSRSLLKRPAQRGAAALKDDEAAEKVKESCEDALEDSEGSGAAHKRDVCINLLDDSDDDKPPSSQPVSSLSALYCYTTLSSEGRPMQAAESRKGLL